MSDFVGMIKHVGILNNTGKNVVVVFMSLRDDPSYALVIDTDALPDNYNESLRKVVESVEGQQAKDLADVLGRRPSPDGSQMTLLQKFHAAGRLEKVLISNVTMTPKRNIRWPLSEIVKAMNNDNEQTPLGFDDLDPDTRAAIAADLQKFNVHETNITSDNVKFKKDEALGLLRQAELLENDAQNMRIKAYKIDPSLSKSLNKKATELALATEKAKNAAKLKLAKNKNNSVTKKTTKKVATETVSTSDLPVLKSNNATTAKTTRKSKDVVNSTETGNNSL